MTVGQAINQARLGLRGASDAPDTEALWLIAFAANIDESGTLLAQLDETLDEKQMQTLNICLQQRRQGVPLAYILGEWEFYGRAFIVSPDVLIPRPATEKLVSESLAVIDAMYNKLGRKISVADIGTGSGCIAITLALESEKISGILAVDISEKALKLAAKNAQALSADGNITFKKMDGFASLNNINVDLIVSNPPYVPSAELTQAGASGSTRGLLFEPAIALDGGHDGRKYSTLIERSGRAAVIETSGARIVALNL